MLMGIALISNSAPDRMKLGKNANARASCDAKNWFRQIVEMKKPVPSDAVKNAEEVMNNATIDPRNGTWKRKYDSSTQQLVDDIPRM